MAAPCAEKFCDTGRYTRNVHFIGFYASYAFFALVALAIVGVIGAVLAYAILECKKRRARRA